MSPWRSISILIAFAVPLLAGSVLAQGDREAGQELIQVKLSRNTEAEEPGAQGGLAGRPPTPREQMYVFWALGKIISYPFDKAEELIRARLGGYKAQTKTASSETEAINPFDSVSLREIPPAPPVSQSPGSSHR